jgi:hypothetical protein
MCTTVFLWLFSRKLELQNEVNRLKLENSTLGDQCLSYTSKVNYHYNRYYHSNRISVCLVHQIIIDKNKIKTFIIDMTIVDMIHSNIFSVVCHEDNSYIGYHGNLLITVVQQWSVNMTIHGATHQRSVIMATYI